MMFDNYSWNAPGEKDELQVKRLDFTGYNSVTLTFDVAYQVYSGYSDSLAVRISTNCGVTFNRIYIKGGSTLSTAGTATADFVPSSTQWRKETINLNAYVGMSGIIIDFQNINGFGNNLYIDNVNINATVAASAGSDRSICNGASTSIGMLATSGVSYLWSPSTGLNFATAAGPTASPSVTTTYILTATQTNSGIFNKDTVLVTVTQNGPAAPTANITQPTCTSSASITVTSSIAGLSFSIDGTNYTNTTGVFTNVSPGSYNLSAKNASSCVSLNTPLTVNSPPAGPPTPTSSVTQPTCPAPTGTITVTSGTSGLSFSIDGSNYSNTNGIFNSLSPGTYSLTAKTSAGCVSVPANATVNAVPTPPATPTTNVTHPTCSTTTGSITVTSGTSGLSFSIDGTNYANTTGIFSNVSPGTYNLTAKNAGACISSPTSVTINQPPNVPVGVAISASPAGAICPGATVMYTATPTNGDSTPSYQWKKNNVNVGTGSTYSTSTLANGDSIKCVLTSNASCIKDNPATTSYVQQVNPGAPVSLTITSGAGNSICSGQSVTFSANTVNGGSSPTYQWRRNGIVVSNTATYTTTALTNNNRVWCTLTSNASCATGNPALSDTITMTVNANVTPVVSIAASPSDSVCSGTPVTFTASPTNGGATPSYQWKKNSTVIGSGNPFSSSLLIDHDTIRCVMTSAATCVTANPVTSSAVIMKISGCTAIVQLKAYLEGYYMGEGMMQPVLFTTNMSTDSSATDSILVQLWSPQNLSNPAYSVGALLHSNGTAAAVFPASASGNSFYIVIRTRNGLETWSKAPVLLGNTPLIFDFSSP